MMKCFLGFIFSFVGSLTVAMHPFVENELRAFSKDVDVIRGQVIFTVRRDKEQVEKAITHYQLTGGDLDERAVIQTVVDTGCLDAIAVVSQLTSSHDLSKFLVVQAALPLAFNKCVIQRCKAVGLAVDQEN